MGSGKLDAGWLQLFDASRWYTRVDAMGFTIPAYNRSSSDQATVSDGHAGEDCDAGTNPHAIAHTDGLSCGGAGALVRWSHLVAAGNEGYAHPNGAVASDRDGGGRVEHALVIHERSGTDGHVAVPEPHTGRHSARLEVETVHAQHPPPKGAGDEDGAGEFVQ